MERFKGKNPQPRCPVEDLATPFLRGEAELRGEGRDGLEPVRRRVNPTAPHPTMEFSSRENG